MALVEELYERDIQIGRSGLLGPGGCVSLSRGAAAGAARDGALMGALLTLWAHIVRDQRKREA